MTEPLPVTGADRALHIVFDGPPGPTAGRFVEVETPDGKSVSAGEWHERSDGYWELRLASTPSTSAVPEGMREALEQAQFLCDRLDDLDWNEDDLLTTANDFNGHVDPALSRLKASLAALPAPVPATREGVLPVPEYDAADISHLESLASYLDSYAQQKRREKLPASADLFDNMAAHLRGYDIVRHFAAAPTAPSDIGDEWRTDMEGAPRDKAGLDLWSVFQGSFDTETGERLTNCRWRDESATFSAGWHDCFGNKIEWSGEDGCSRRVTAWRPIPAAPTVAQGEGI